MCTVRESAVLPFHPLSTTTITMPIGYLPWGKFLTHVHAQLPVLLLGGVLALVVVLSSHTLNINQLLVLHTWGHGDNGWVFSGIGFPPSSRSLYQCPEWCLQPYDTGSLLLPPGLPSWKWWEKLIAGPLMDFQFSFLINGPWWSNIPVPNFESLPWASAFPFTRGKRVWNELCTHPHTG